MSFAPSDIFFICHTQVHKKEPTLMGWSLTPQTMQSLTFLFLGLEWSTEQHALKHKQLFEYKHLLLLRDIWWSKF
jgi:hypothetical protein